MGLKNIEDILERLVEGVFSRAFKSEMHPIELGRRLIKEIDSNRKLDVKGRAIAPNSFVVSLSPEDYLSFVSVETSIVKELAATAREYARSEDLGFLGPLSVSLKKDDKAKVGLSRVITTYDDSLDEGEDSHCWIEGQGGVIHQLKNRVMSLGRLNECDIVIDDENISRRHAELKPVGDTFELVDLGSTNGCKVNGTRKRTFELKDGDEIILGPAKLWFRQG